MGKFQPSRLAASSPRAIAYGLALAADRTLWAGNQSKCIVIIDQLYELHDALERGLEPDVYSSFFAAETAAWVDGKPTFEEDLSNVDARG